MAASSELKVGRIETIEYGIPIGGKDLRLLGPRAPYAIFSDPNVVRRSIQEGYSPYWTEPWVGALMLAEFVLAHYAPSDEPALEIGAGLGLCGLGLTLHGFKVLMTDYDADALEFIRASAELNGLSPHGIAPVDWREQPSHRHSLILGADVMYERKCHDYVIAYLARCLSFDGVALLSDPNRGDADLMIEVIQRNGMTVEMVPVISKAIPRPGSMDGRRLRGRVLVIRRANNAIIPAE